MKKTLRNASAALAVGLAALFPAGAAHAQADPEWCAQQMALPQDTTPEGGVLVMATFTMDLYSYYTFREAVEMEVGMMADAGIKFVRSYRVLYGEMDKYVDIWWACDYDTFTEAFYDLTYPKPGTEFAEALEGNNPLREATVEIVSLELFPQED